MGVPNVRQLPNNSAPQGAELDRRWDAPMRRGGSTSMGWTSAGMHEAYTARETCPRRVAGAGGVSHPVAF